MVGKIRLKNIETKLWSTSGYASHSELTRKKLKDKISTKKLGHFIWKYKNNSSLPHLSTTN